MDKIKCIDCDSENVSEPDSEGFVDCFDCGAAWIPGHPSLAEDEAAARARRNEN